MNNYTIYCTPEQTKKALELGAPIEKLMNHPIDKEICDKYHFLVIDGVCYNNPTTEQMIGWLEERGITIEMVKCDMHWFGRAYSDENTYFNKGRFVSRKEATLAAIDAALEYLKESRKNENKR